MRRRQATGTDSTRLDWTWTLVDYCVTTSDLAKPRMTDSTSAFARSLIWASRPRPLPLGWPWLRCAAAAASGPALPSPIAGDAIFAAAASEAASSVRIATMLNCRFSTAMFLRHTSIDRRDVTAPTPLSGDTGEEGWSVARLCISSVTPSPLPSSSSFHREAVLQT